MSKSKQNRPLSGVSNCIFCGGPDLTAEHIIPKWLRKKYPVTDTREIHRVETVDMVNNYREKLRGYLSESKGSMKRKLPCACSNCNNGWMSIIQVKAKPVVERLIEAPYCALSNDERLVFSSWAVMTAMVFEYSSPEMISVHEYQRVHLATHGAFMTDRWSVMVGMYEGLEDSIGWYTAAFIDDGSEESKRRDPFWRVHRSTFHVGRLLWHTIGFNRFTIPEDELLMNCDSWGLRMVWPVDYLPMSALGTVRRYGDIRALQHTQIV